jgi:hypothetical protein
VATQQVLVSRAAKSIMSEKLFEQSVTVVNIRRALVKKTTPMDRPAARVT